MHISSLSRAIWIAVAATVLIFAFACGSNGGPPELPTEEELAPPPPTQSAPQQPANTPTPRPASAESSEEEPTAVPTATSPREYDSVLPMSKIFQGISSTVFNEFSPNPELAIDGMKSARDAGDKSMVPVIVTLMRFINREAVFEEAVLTLNELTGEDFGTTPAAWPAWFEWVGANLDDYRPPDGYPQLKRRFLASIHPGFEQFLQGYEDTSRIEPFEIEWGGVAPDGIPPLEFPPNIPADEAEYLESHERVFGVSINGEHRAYPLRIMNPHEMANDVLGGEPISLAYCTLCGAGIAYHGEFDGMETTFGTSGFLYRSNKIMYDRETLSLWNQETGQPVIGELADSGIQLNFFPTLLTTWGEWTDEHPDTTVLALDTGVSQPGSYFPEDNPNATYYEYFNTPGTMFPVWIRDDSLEAKDVVLGVNIGEAQKAYPVSVLQVERVVNDTLGETNVVVLGSEISQAAKAYERGDQEFSRVEGDTSTGVPNRRSSSTRTATCGTSPKRRWSTPPTRPKRCPAFRPTRRSGSAGTPFTPTPSSTRAGDEQRGSRWSSALVGDMHVDGIDDQRHADA